ncbi:MAG TPA: nodulation protein NodZ [Chlamydiales bacterium]|nr:nodulation protein NodZ [Chlamydiales bacterium]
MFWLFLFLAATVSAEPPGFIAMKCRSGAGMFSIFNDMLAALKMYDQGKYEGIAIEFGQEGVYYDPLRGDNWWNYYCEPIALGQKGPIQEVYGDAPCIKRREIEFYTTREEASRLIQKYIHFQPTILQKAQAFQQKHFANRYTIGVHYRGTDKMRDEATRVHYPEVMKAIREAIHSARARGIANYQIFAASDEQPFIDFIRGLFQGHFCCQEEALRSSQRMGKPAHLNPTLDRSRCGEETILDCLLLSHCDELIRTSSNLSLWALFLNPNLPSITLNQRFDDEPQ